MIEILALVVLVVAFAALVWHTRKSLFLLLLLALPVMAQNCDSIVTDDAGMLAAQQAKVEQAAGSLINQGADVRVRTLVSSGGNLDLAENALEKACPSWQGTNGTRKSTLLVLMVSKDRKLGVYYGAAWHKALDDHWNRIKTDYMVPRFKSGDFAGGFIAAEDQFTKRIVASKDEALKPAVSTTVNQATDYSGLWTVFEWLMFIVFFGFVASIIWQIYVALAKRKQAIASAQQRATDFRNTAAHSLKTIEDNISLKEATGATVPQEAKNYFQNASDDYGRLDGNLNTNPDTEGLTAAQYESIGIQYGRICDQLLKAANLLRGKVKDITSAPLTPDDINKPDFGQRVTPPAPAPTQQPVPAPVQPAPAPVHHSETNVVIVSTPEYEYSPRTYTPPEPVYTPPEPTYTRHRDEDSGSGGSSSWGSSSDSDSSSGGSSSYDSGSNDSGGGGSSDY